MKKKFSRELIIGLCVLLAIVIVIFGINFLKGINLFKAANYYYVTYENVTGLSKSAPVTLNGFKVGLVRDMSYEYDNPGNVVVELSLDKELKVPRGSKAVLVTDMLGTATIELQLAANTDTHTVGDYLEGFNKKGLMESLTTDLMPNIGSILHQLDSIMGSINAVVSDPALTSSVKALDGVMADLIATTANLNKVMAQMPSVAKNAGATMENARSISESANTIAADLAAVTGQLREARLDSTLNNINSLTTSLADITQTLTTNESSLGMLINDPTFYNSLNSSVASLDSLLRDVKRNPKRYISIKLL